MRTLVHDLVGSVHEACLEDRSGEILHGIPALEDVDPESFGICLATADGHVYEVGDTRLPFCIQSISKAFTYGIALTDHGVDAVDAKIDVEPSGELFNQISLHPATHRPRNPMINAGAIAASSLVAGATVAEQVDRVVRVYVDYAGQGIALDPDIYASQLESGHRNRAIAHMLREFGILEGDPNDAIEVYLRQCSMMVDCRDLAMMGATLANSGTNPRTGTRVLAPELAERVLSVMSTCGMYDAAGEWVAHVGMAAKSGVGGGIVAVLPGQLSIAVFSPRLDEHGNSVRGIAACRRLSRELELHAMHVARGAHSAIRDSYDIVEAPSSMQRPEADRLVLEEHGRGVRIYELHGDLLFAGAESVVRRICDDADELQHIVLDVRRITDVAQVSRGLLRGLRAFLAERDCEFSLVDPDGLLGDGMSDNGGGPARRTFPSLAAATVFLEDLLLERHGERRDDEAFDFRAHPAVVGHPGHLIDGLGRRLQTRTYADGELIVAEGDAETGLFMVVSGRVRTSLTTANGATRNLATLQPGNCLGDVYVVTGNPHAVSAHADGPVELLELTREELASIREDDLELRAMVLEVLMYEIHDDVNRALRSLANGRVTPMTAS